MIDGQTIQITAHEALGLLGATVYSVSYVLSAYDRLPSQSPLYYLSKLVAAVLVLISLSQNFNLASAVIQIFFVTVSVIGIFRHLDARRRSRAYAQSQHAPGGTAATPVEDFLATKKPSAGYAPFHERPTPLTENFRSKRLFARQDL